MIDERQKEFLLSTCKNLSYSVLRMTRRGEAWKRPNNEGAIFYHIRMACTSVMLAWATAEGDPCMIPEGEIFEITGQAYDEAKVKLIKEGVFDKDGLPISA